MQNLHQRKIKQKIAKRMVTFSALNYSRPRDDTGKPLLQTRARFYSHHVSSPSSAEVQRTLSDPDLYRDSLKRNKKVKTKLDLCIDNYLWNDTLNSVKYIKNYTLRASQLYLNTRGLANSFSCE